MPAEIHRLISAGSTTYFSKLDTSTNKTVLSAPVIAGTEPQGSGSEHHSSDAGTSTAELSAVTLCAQQSSLTLDPFTSAVSQ